MLELDFLIGNNSVTLFCELALALVLIINLANAFQRNANIGTGYFILFLVMLVYCVLYSPLEGDNYTSMESYYSYLGGVDSEKLHFEDIYFSIMDIIPFGYVYYRLFVWGLACLLCVWFLKKLNINSHIATLAVLSFALPILLYYQRAAFAYILLYVALYCYISKGALFESNNFFKKQYRGLFIVLMLCTLPFHRAMAVYVVISLIALFIPKNKYGITCLLIGMLVFSTSTLANSLLVLEQFSTDTRETAMVYLENDTSIVGQNANGALANFLRLIPLYSMILYGLYKIIDNPNYFQEFEKVCLLNTLILVFISNSFTDSSFSVQVKFYNAAMMPWTLFLASYYNRNRGSLVCSVYAFTTLLVSFI